VEALRARPGRRIVGEDFWEWGLPTGAVVRALHQTLGAHDDAPQIIASGGIRSGHDIARAIALGATAGGMALPMLRAVQEGGFDAADARMQHVIDGIEVAMLLTGSTRPQGLTAVPRHIGAELGRWTETLVGVWSGQTTR